jgi:hypothetical protein
MTRRLTNQDAFDGAMLNLLNQGHSVGSAGGRARYRGRHGKSAVGALIPDEIYMASMEGKNVRHWLAARGSEYDALRERLGGVTLALLDELEDLHDRIGTCMPSLYRQLAVAGAQRIAHSFKLSMSLVQRCAAYQHLRGPRIFSMMVTRVAPTPPPIMTNADEVAPTLQAVAPAAVPALAAAPTLAVAPDLTPTPALVATPTLAQEPVQLPEPQQNDLDLIARGIARAIAASRGA